MAIIGYVRVSTSEQTVINQKKQIAETYNVDKWFCDEAVSGTTSAASRDGFKAMLGYVREGDTVITVAVDRLGRNTIDVLSSVESLREKGVKLVSMREGFDLSTETGKAMLTIMSAMAQLELANLAERRAAGIKRAQSEGIHCGRPKADTDSIQRLRASGMSQSKVAAELGIGIATVKRHWNM
ncbi:TPA: recombinase family protein [Enterobacter asburiae]|nr:recombinase family protein [Enterobacter asburiae]